MASIAVENSLFAEEREANRIKDEFLSTLSHELRTPLNAILGWTQILMMEEPDGEVGHALEIIERNARAQTKLIEDLLDVSRITTGKLRLSTNVVAIGPIVQAAADAVRPTAEARGVAIEVRLPETPHRLVADPDRLQQVVWNLLSNAVKFTPSGGQVAVAAEQVGAAVQIRVSDTGQGIDPAFLPYVFDRFRQADSTSTRSHGGLGIGLTIVRHIVELHGGTVRADSAGEGRGSVFTVSLPITAASDLPDLPPVTPGRADGGTEEPALDGKGLAGARILVLDDSHDAREILALILRRAGAHVTTASTPQEARLLLPDAQPDVIVSDIAMPDEDGFEFIQSVRMLPEDCGGTIPAVALTAYAREEDRLKALAAGFQAHMAKPIEPNDLIGLVAQFAPRDGIRREPAPQAG
jgi:CheY-like chemotaxis protein/anti-sigma regulatory factor (Ser/Thr protein kinase)